MTRVEAQRNTLLLGLQASLVCQTLVEPVSASCSAVRMCDSRGGVIDLFGLTDGDRVCLDAGLVAEDFTRRMVCRINAALDLARALPEVQS